MTHARHRAPPEGALLGARTFLWVLSRGILFVLLVLLLLGTAVEGCSRAIPIEMDDIIHGIESNQTTGGFLHERYGNTVLINVRTPIFSPLS